MVSFKDPKIWREFAKACLGLPKPSLRTRLPNGRPSVCPGNPPALSPTGPLQLHT